MVRATSHIKIDASVDDKTGKPLNQIKKNVGDAAKAVKQATGVLSPFQRSMKKLAMTALTLGLSMLFAGMAMKQFGQKVLKSLINTFKRATEGSKAYSHTIGKVGAAFEFLKFTIIDTFMQTAIGKIILDKLVNKLNELSEWIQDKPNLATAIVGGSAGLVILGTALMILGQITSAMSGLIRLGMGTEASGLSVMIGAEKKARGALTSGAIKKSPVGTAALGAGAGIKKVSKSLVEGKAIRKFISKLSEASKSGLFGKVAKSLGGIGKVLGKLFFWLGVITAIWDFLKGVVIGFTKAMEASKKKNDNFATGLKVIIGFFKLLWKAIMFGLDMITGVIMFLGELVGGLIAMFIELLGVITKVVSSITDVSKNPFLKVGSSIVNSISGDFLPRKLAQGGIVTSPTTALIGEGGPEAVIPLARGGQTNNMGGVNVTVNVSNPGASAQQIGSAVIENIQRELRRSGLGSGL